MILIPKQLLFKNYKKHQYETNPSAEATYFNEKSSLYQEPSWINYKSSNYQMIECENTPITGIGFPKRSMELPSRWVDKVNYVKLTDPRGFNINISFTNLEWILQEYPDMVNGKFTTPMVYAWEGVNHILIPVTSKHYKLAAKASEAMFDRTWLTPTKMTIGHEYEMSDNTTRIYMGKHIYHDWRSSKPKHCFIKPNSNYFDAWATITRKVIKDVSGKIHKDYTKFVHQMEHSTEFSKHDKTKDKFIPLDFDSFNSWHIEQRRAGKQEPNIRLYMNTNIPEFSERYGYHTRNLPGSSTLVDVILKAGELSVEYYTNAGNYGHRGTKVYSTLQEFINKYKPGYVEQYLENGNKYNTEFNLV